MRLNCLNAATACATVAWPGKFRSSGGNYFWFGAPSHSQPAHASRANNRRGKNYPRSTSSPIRSLLGDYFSKMVSARRTRTQNDPISRSVSRREWASEPEKLSFDRGKNSAYHRVRRGLRRTFRAARGCEARRREVEEPGRRGHRDADRSRRGTAEAGKRNVFA